MVCETLSKKILSYFFFFFFLNAVTTTVCVAYLTFKITPPYCTVQLYELVSKYIPPEVLDVDLFLLCLGQRVQYTFQQDFFSLNQQLKKAKQKQKNDKISRNKPKVGKQFKLNTEKEILFLMTINNI